MELYEVDRRVLDGVGRALGRIQKLDAEIRARGIDWILRDDPATLKLVADGVAHGCDVCSRHRRRSLYRIAAELGCPVVALGHTADDCAEALFRNGLFNGRTASLPAVARSRKGTLRLIRPLVYGGEELIGAGPAKEGADPSPAFANPD